MSEVGREEVESDEDEGEVAEELDSRTAGELMAALRRSEELEMQLAAVKAEQAAERVDMAAKCAELEAERATMAVMVAKCAELEAERATMAAKLAALEAKCI